jgi:hypothetical protein
MVYAIQNGNLSIVAISSSIKDIGFVLQDEQSDLLLLFVNATGLWQVEGAQRLLGPYHGSFNPPWAWKFAQPVIILKDETIRSIAPIQREDSVNRLGEIVFENTTSFYKIETTHKQGEIAWTEPAKYKA